MRVLRYAAFSADPAGGNPAGVVLDASGADDATMLRVAAEVGYSETAFLFPNAGTPGTPGTPGANGANGGGADGGAANGGGADRGGEVGGGEVGVRYFSPLAEVPFCGHATIAAAVAWADRYGPGRLDLRTRAGRVEVTTEAGAGVTTATLVSVPPRVQEMSDVDLHALLDLFGWAVEDLDPLLPPRIGYAGAWHPILAAATRRRLAALDYDLAGLSALMAARDWTTIDLVWRESATVFWARNPFPPGGVFEDPATGAAAAAFGGYLRDLGLVETPATVTVHQGDDLGRPGVITVGIGAAGSGIAVSGQAVPLDDRAERGWAERGWAERG